MYEQFTHTGCSRKTLFPQIHWNPRLYIAPRGWSGKKQIYLLSKNAPVSGHFHYWGFMSRNCVQFILYRVYTIVVFIGKQRKKRLTSRRKLITIFAYFTKSSDRGLKKSSKQNQRNETYDQLTQDIYSQQWEKATEIRHQPQIWSVTVAPSLICAFGEKENWITIFAFCIWLYNIIFAFQNISLIWRKYKNNIFIGNSKLYVLSLLLIKL